MTSSQFFSLLGRGRTAVLIFLYGFGVNQVGDIKQHSVGIHFLAAHFFF